MSETTKGLSSQPNATQSQDFQAFKQQLWQGRDDELQMSK